MPNNLKNLVASPLLSRAFSAMNAVNLRSMGSITGLYRIASVGNRTDPSTITCSLKGIATTIANHLGWVVS